MKCKFTCADQYSCIIPASIAVVISHGTCQEIPETFWLKRDHYTCNEFVNNQKDWFQFCLYLSKQMEGFPLHLLFSRRGQIWVKLS